MEMDRPYITKRSNGEYSTVLLPNGFMETCWFPDEGEPVVIGRTYIGKLGIAEKHINEWEASKDN